MSVPPVFPVAFYKLLAKGAKQFGLTRERLAMAAVRQFIHKKESRDAPLAKRLGSEELAELYKEASRKASKDWWSTLTAKERRERSQRAITARWGKKKKSP